MRLFSRLSDRPSPRRHSRLQAVTSRYVPRVELLEDRQLLAPLVALTGANTLLSFDSSLPAAATTTAVTGLPQNETLQAIAVRPATHQLYALSFSHLYTVEVSTGAATPVGDSDVSLGLTGSELAMSFDPVADRLRVLTAQVVNKVPMSEQNLTISPDTGVVFGTGRTFQYVPGDIHSGRTPRLNRLAYTNQFPGATSTTLYAIDDMPHVPDNLVTLGGPAGVPAPDQGQVFTVAATDSSAAFTIAGSDNTAFALAPNEQNDSELDLCTLNLASGALTRLRSSVAPAPVTGLVALPTGPVQLPALSINDVSVNESSSGPVNAVFTVSLSAPGSQPVEVQVRTGNGTAQAPLEYQPLSATLTFQPGQTSQTVTIPVRDNRLMGGVETFFVNLSNPSNATIGRGRGVATITNDPLVMPPVNVLFVQALYQDLLGRLPDPVEQGYWRSALDAGVSPVSVVEAILNSPEYTVDQVETLYGALLHHPADPGGLNDASVFLEQGGAPEVLKAFILGSQEYFMAHGGTSQGFLAGVYQDEFGRAIDPLGATSWAAALANGVPRVAVAGLIVASQEADAQSVGRFYRKLLHRKADPPAFQHDLIALGATNSWAAKAALLNELIVNGAISSEYVANLGQHFLSLEFVDKLYHDLLNRSPDPGGLNGWVNALNNGMSRESVVIGFVTSPEYRQDLGGDPTIFGRTDLPGGGTIIDERVYIFTQQDFSNPDPPGRDSNFVLGVFHTFMGLNINLRTNMDPLVLMVEDNLNSRTPSSYRDLSYMVVADPRAGTFRAVQYYDMFLGGVSPNPAETVAIDYPGHGSPTPTSPVIPNFGLIAGQFVQGIDLGFGILASRVASSEEIFMAALLGTNEYFPRS